MIRRLPPSGAGEARAAAAMDRALAGPSASTPLAPATAAAPIPDAVLTDAISSCADELATTVFSTAGTLAVDVSLLLRALWFGDYDPSQKERLRKLASKHELGDAQLLTAVRIATRRLARGIALLDGRIAVALSTHPLLKAPPPLSPLSASVSMSVPPLPVASTLLVSVTATDDHVRGPKTKTFLNLAKSRDNFFSLLRSADAAYTGGKPNNGKTFTSKVQEMLAELLDENIAPFAKWLCDVILLRCISHTLHTVYPSMSPLSGDFAKMQLMDRALERRSPGSPAPTIGVFRGGERFFADFLRAAESYRLNICFISELQLRMHSLHDLSLIRDHTTGLVRTDALTERILGLRLLGKLYGFIQGGPFWALVQGAQIRLPPVASAPVVLGCSPVQLLLSCAKSPAVLLCLPWICDYARALLYSRDPPLVDPALCDLVGALSAVYADVQQAMQHVPLVESSTLSSDSKTLLAERLLLDDISDLLSRLRPSDALISIPAGVATDTADVDSLQAATEGLPGILTERLVSELLPGLSDVLLALEQPRKPSKRVNPTQTSSKPSTAQVSRDQLETWFVWQHPMLKENVEFVCERVAATAVEAAADRVGALLEEPVFSAWLLEGGARAGEEPLLQAEEDHALHDLFAERVVELCQKAATERATLAVQTLAPAHLADMVMGNLLTYTSRVLSGALLDKVNRLIAAQLDGWRSKAKKTAAASTKLLAAAEGDVEAAETAPHELDTAALTSGDPELLIERPPASLAATLARMCASEGVSDQAARAATASFARVVAALPPRVIDKLLVDYLRTASALPAAEQLEARHVHVARSLQSASGRRLSLAYIVNAVGEGSPAAHMATMALT